MAGGWAETFSCSNDFGRVAEVLMERQHVFVGGCGKEGLEQ